jgi:hypothetical protein
MFEPLRTNPYCSRLPDGPGHVAPTSGRASGGPVGATSSSTGAVPMMSDDWSVSSAGGPRLGCDGGKEEG